MSRLRRNRQTSKRKKAVIIVCRKKSEVSISPSSLRWRQTFQSEVHSLGFFFLVSHGLSCSHP